MFFFFPVPPFRPFLRGSMYSCFCAVSPSNCSITSHQSWKRLFIYCTPSIFFLLQDLFLPSELSPTTVGLFYKIFSSGQRIPSTDLFFLCKTLDDHFFPVLSPLFLFVEIIPFPSPEESLPLKRACALDLGRSPLHSHPLIGDLSISFFRNAFLFQGIS